MTMSRVGVKGMDWAFLYQVKVQGCFLADVLRGNLECDQSRQIFGGKQSR